MAMVSLQTLLAVTLVSKPLQCSGECKKQGANLQDWLALHTQCVPQCHELHQSWQGARGSPPPLLQPPCTQNMNTITSGLKTTDCACELAGGERGLCPCVYTHGCMHIQAGVCGVPMLGSGNRVQGGRMGGGGACADAGKQAHGC